MIVYINTECLCVRGGGWGRGWIKARSDLGILVFFSGGGSGYLYLEAIETLPFLLPSSSSSSSSPFRSRGRLLLLRNTHTLPLEHREQCLRALQYLHIRRLCFANDLCIYICIRICKHVSIIVRLHKKSTIPPLPPALLLIHYYHFVYHMYFFLFLYMYVHLYVCMYSHHPS